ncbi:leucine-rich_repeat domain-containing protein [Hexamita inflata]|uniref:Partial n=1 Tax=Hexamita inflata TaxID=28002 RepID=A0AA86UYN0_9EUKA|nr:leucine-rich repeat domain-containing protein [Hexamita inflata]
MQSNNEIRSQEDLLSHFGSSKQLEILDLQQMERYLEMNVQPEVWKDAQNRNLLFFNLEFVQETKQFTFGYRKIQYINLISFLTNLTELDLSKNQISDISSLSKLTNLKTLDLSINSIEDISALLSLTDLIFLNLYQNKYTSYTLALPNLVDLSLSGNPPYLSNFVDLQILNLGENKQLQNIGPLQFCTQLTELYIFETSVADIWSLQFMKNLKILYISYTKVVDLHPLQNLYQLEYIIAHHTRIIDISPLWKLTQLKQMYFWNNKITNAETLKHHQKFSNYNFSDQEVPTTDELKFYNKILSVHNSRKQITKLILAENRVSKFREQLTNQKESINLKINEQILTVNMKIEIWAQFIQNSYADQ